MYQSWLRRAQSKALAASKSGKDGDEKKAQAVFLASRLAVDIEILPDGKSSLLWIGDRKRAKKFVLFFHGGGYVVPAIRGHFEWCARAYLLSSQNVKSGGAEEGEEIAVAFLQYTLSPDATYPMQLQQAVDALFHILRMGTSPMNLIIGGDSAGGNLVAQLLSHILHPHPEVKGVTIPEPLAGAFLVSPWLSAKTHWFGYKRNGGIDMFDKNMIITHAPGVLGDVAKYDAEMAAGKGWSFPMDLPNVEGWFAGLETVVRNVYITAGEQECFVDQCVGFAEAVKHGNPGMPVRLEVSRNEAHDWILMEAEHGVEGDATKRMKAWIREAFWPQSSS